MTEKQLEKEINRLEEELKYYKSKSASLETGLLDERRKNQQLYEENKELRNELFEVSKSYLIETADISDKLYLDDEIKELAKELRVDYE